MRAFLNVCINKEWCSCFSCLTHWTVSQNFFLDMVLWKVVFSRDKQGECRFTTTQPPQVGNQPLLSSSHQLCTLHCVGCVGWYSIVCCSTFPSVPGISFFCKDILENSWQAFVTDVLGLQKFQNLFSIPISFMSVCEGLVLSGKR